MNLNDFEFLGFYEVVPNYLVLLISALGIGMAFYSYYNYKSIPYLSKSALITLRSLIYIILGILLLNPVYQHTQFIEEKPELAILIDQSVSTSITKGSWNGPAMLPQLTQTINEQLNNDFDLRWVGFDSDVYEIDIIDSLHFSGSQTDIGLAISNTVSNYAPDQILLVSDGIVTRGRDPLFIGQSMNIPIHTVAIGDSTRIQDIVVSFVEYSSEMVTDTEYSVLVGIRNDGFMGNQTRVTLSNNGTQLESKDIVFQNDNGIQQIDFSISSSIEGLQEYEITVEPLELEWSTENNDYDFSVNFIDNRVDILYLTYQFHPDVSIIKQILFEYPEISVTELTWNGNSFLQNINLLDSDDYDLILIHGVPSANQTDEIERLRNLITEQNTVLFMLPGSSTNLVYSSILSASSGFQSDGSSLTWTQSQIFPEASQSGHPVLELPTYNWTRSPLVTLPTSGLNMRSGNLSLLISPQYSNIPAISSQRVGNSRSTVISFSGFGSFFLAGNIDDRSIFSELIGNVITWSASDVNQNLFELKTDKTQYSTRENPIFNAKVFREGGLPESGATVELELSNGESGNRNFSLQNTGNGNYSLSVPGLPVGLYNYTGTARRDDFNIGTISGSFSVGSSQQELINTTRQDYLLSQLSNLTGGFSAEFSSIETILDEIQKNSSTTMTMKTDIFNLYKYPVWFVIILLFVTSEWILRRKYLLP